MQKDRHTDRHSADYLPWSGVRAADSPATKSWAQLSKPVRRYASFNEIHNVVASSRSKSIFPKAPCSVSIRSKPSFSRT
jgi:hypothetical protein